MLPIVTNHQQTEAIAEHETCPLWTVDEVAKYLVLNPETIRQMARRAQIPGFKMGRVWRFRIAEIKAWVQQKGSGFKPD